MILDNEMLIVLHNVLVEREQKANQVPIHHTGI